MLEQAGFKQVKAYLDFTFTQTSAADTSYTVLGVQ